MDLTTDSPTSDDDLPSAANFSVMSNANYIYYNI